MKCSCGEEMVYLGIDGDKQFYSCPVCGHDEVIGNENDDDGQ